MTTHAPVPGPSPRPQSQAPVPGPSPRPQSQYPVPGTGPGRPGTLLSLTSNKRHHRPPAWIDRGQHQEDTPTRHERERARETERAGCWQRYEAASPAARAREQKKPSPATDERLHRPAPAPAAPSSGQLAVDVVLLAIAIAIAIAIARRFAVAISSCVLRLDLNVRSNALLPKKKEKKLQLARGPALVARAHPDKRETSHGSLSTAPPDRRTRAEKRPCCGGPALLEATI
ncbi:hypothetical protein TESG_08555 [Trichophyton tonsurans CBS 112818]|uniref:Uncharacterized protein n=1 Tax=Trichophyton tonsurans (strain CBS 112818) TaxID=647933 RepID=F2S5D2_TRIT1|nr:hypothetical protein TESG_08555 [Trichophyton tonsurans CBS 112818]